MDVEAHGLVSPRNDVNPVRAWLEHGTAVIESKIFRESDVIAVGEYLRSWRMNIKNEPRKRRLLNHCRCACSLIDDVALDDDFALDDEGRSVWNEHDVRSALRASVARPVISVTLPGSPMLSIRKPPKAVVGQGD